MLLEDETVLEKNSVKIAVKILVLKSNEKYLVISILVKNIVGMYVYVQVHNS